MPDLAAFQRDFASALMADGPAAPSLGSQAFALYRNTTARGAIEALRASYPTVDMLVGAEMFTQVALDYRRQHPLMSPVLSDHGSDFAAFLAKQPWTRELPYLADIARLDWLWLESFLAQDRDPSPQSIAGEKRFALHPATRFAWLATPAMTIWQAHRAPRQWTELDPDWIEEGALFTRPGPTIRAERIDAAFHHLLIACATPVSGADLDAAVSRAFPEARVPELRRRGIACGALIIQ